LRMTGWAITRQDMTLDLSSGFQAGWRLVVFTGYGQTNAPLIATSPSSTRTSLHNMAYTVCGYRCQLFALTRAPARLAGRLRHAPATAFIFAGSSVRGIAVATRRGWTSAYIFSFWRGGTVGDSGNRKGMVDGQPLRRLVTGLNRRCCSLCTLRLPCHQ